MSAAKLSLAELRDRLHGHGETAPKAWTRAQILLGLVELDGDHILKTEKDVLEISQDNKAMSVTGGRRSPGGHRV